MFTFILVMASGIIIGYILRNRSKIHKVELLIHTTIRIMLFLLGLSIGLNKLIISNWSYFCGQAVVISSLSIFGSLLASLIVYKVFFKKKM